MLPRLFGRGNDEATEDPRDPAFWKEAVRTFKGGQFRLLYRVDGVNPILQIVKDARFRSNALSLELSPALQYQGEDWTKIKQEFYHRCFTLPQMRELKSVDGKILFWCQAGIVTLLPSGHPEVIQVPDLSR